MPAIEEKNIGRARLIAKERSQAVKPIQKVLRAAQFSQFNLFKKKRSLNLQLKAGFGELCEDQMSFDPQQQPFKPSLVMLQTDSTGKSRVHT